MSVIRRKHTTNFTTISNALRDDERLAADELGILYFLLTQPQDWEIRRPQLRKRFKIGRDGMKRIMDNWLRTGWLRAEKTRLSNGQFTITYEVHDEAGPALSDDEVQRALSLVSSEAAETYASDEEMEPEVCISPHTPQPGVVDQQVATRDWQESLNKDSQNTIPPKKPAVWRDLRDAWPPSEILSSVACEKLFAQLSQKDRQRAFEGAKPYLERCKDRARKICDLSTYLKQRRFETAESNGANCSLTVCKPATPEAGRWIQHYESRGVADLKPAERYALRQLKQGQTTTVPSQWPPAVPPKQQSTGPPSPLRPEDEEYLQKHGLG